MYKNWTIPELENEAARIQEMIKDNVQQTPPEKFKQFEAEKALELKRMKEELITADYGSKNSVSKWGEARVRATYKRLEELRKKDPTAPQKPDYSKAEVSKRPPKLQIKRNTAPAGAAIYKRRSKNQSGAGAESIQDLDAGNDLVKEGIRLMMKEESELEQSASTA
ncbi:hypothetical protein HanIR_Chr12g0582921 [Helianthus annuus]|nr:hypothetical protein HanIR_Chr12g0582921 [Helianthus annuus]